jgi:hypothetical protein
MPIILPVRISDQGEPMKAAFRDAIFFLCLFILFWNNSIAQKTDIILLENGDRVTGEIKSLEFGRLSYSTNSMSTVSIKWNRIKAITSLDKYFRVERTDGFSLYGSLDTDTTARKILVLLDTIAIALEREEIVRITPIEQTFLDRIKLSVKLGFNYTKSSDVAQLNFSGYIRYRTYSSLPEINWSASYTRQQDKDLTQRSDLNLKYRRYFKRKWFFDGSMGMQKNSELGLDLRLLINSAGGRNIIQTNSSLFTTQSGIQGTREWANSSETSHYYLEGLVGFDFYRFIYDDPEVNLTSKAHYFPGLSDWGRHRAELNIDLKWEILSDLFWVLTFYDSFDSRPLKQGAPKNDYGVTFSLEWNY